LAWVAALALVALVALVAAVAGSVSHGGRAASVPVHGPSLLLKAAPRLAGSAGGGPSSTHSGLLGFGLAALAVFTTWSATSSRQAERRRTSPRGWGWGTRGPPRL
jgi:hypothetical protein